MEVILQQLLKEFVEAYTEEFFWTSFLGKCWKSLKSFTKSLWGFLVEFLSIPEDSFRKTFKISGVCLYKLNIISKNLVEPLDECVEDSLEEILEKFCEEPLEEFESNIWMNL